MVRVEVLLTRTGNFHIVSLHTEHSAWDYRLSELEVIMENNLIQSLILWLEHRELK
jgi:hypothetical protein